MFDFSADYDPVTPTAGELIAELRLDARPVRDALAADRARHCTDREAPTSPSINSPWGGGPRGQSQHCDRPLYGSN